MLALFCFIIGIMYHMPLTYWVIGFILWGIDSQTMEDLKQKMKNYGEDEVAPLVNLKK